MNTNGETAFDRGRCPATAPVLFLSGAVLLLLAGLLPQTGWASDALRLLPPVSEFESGEVPSAGGFRPFDLREDENATDLDGPERWQAPEVARGTGFLGRLLQDRPEIVDGPVIPEPMVFDMVRPMHARRGELEFNTLAVVPLNRRGGPVDWAPEIEYAIADGLGLEFEVPFLDHELDALKFAAQYTFGVGLDNKLIHGYHGIYEYEFDGAVSILSSLYLLGLRLDEIWTVMGMFGYRATIFGEAGGQQVELIQNVSIFADVTERLVLGVETNMAHFLGGPSTLLVVPQAHWEFSRHISLQMGGGFRSTAARTIPLAAARLVFEY